MAGSGEDRPEGAPRPVASRTPARLEWAAAAVAGLVVLWVVWGLVREALNATDSPPDLRLVLAAPVAQDGRAHLRFTLSNHGSRTAAAVGIALELRDGQAIASSRRLTVDYVPGNSEVTGGFYLEAHDPRLVPAGVVEGYVDP